jgi:nicotinamidase-related amidase
MAKGKIYTELQEIIAPEHSALIVWDMQNRLVNRVFNRDEILNSVDALIQTARKVQVPVVYTKITQLGSPSANEPGAMEIAEAVAPLPVDIILNKNTASIFLGTNMDYIARYGGIETLVFTGISTEFGVETSAREALTRGYYVLVVSDGVSSASRDAHERSLTNLRSLCEVVDHKEILRVWGLQAVS